MKQELLELVSNLEFDEIEDVLKEKGVTNDDIRLFLQEEATRRCKVTIDEAQQQLNYLLNMELSVEEMMSDVLSVLEGTDLAIDIQNPFSTLEEIDDQIEGLYPCCYESGEEEYCGGLVGIAIEFEAINDSLDEEAGDVYEWDEEVEEVVITDVNVYYSSSQMIGK